MRTPRPILRAGLVGGLAVVALLRLAACGGDPVIPGPTGQPDPGWTLVNPRPFNVTVTAAWGPDMSRLVVGGGYGRLAMLQHGAWQAVPSPATTTILDIDGSDWEHIWAVCPDGLLRFDGKGWRWEIHEDLGPAARVRANAPDDVMLVWRPLPAGTDEFLDPRYRHFDGTAWCEGVLDISMTTGARDFLAGDGDGRFAVCGTSAADDGSWQGTLLLWEQGAWRPFPTDLVRYLSSVTFFTYGNRYWAACGYDQDNDRTRLLLLRESRWSSRETWDGDPGVRLAAAAKSAVLAAVLTDRQTGAQTLYRLYQEDIDLSDSEVNVVAVVPSYDQGPLAKVVLGGSWSTLRAVESQGAVVDTLTAGIPLKSRGLCAWPGGDFAAITATTLVQGRGGVLTEKTFAGTRLLTAVWGATASDVYIAATEGILVRLRDGAAPELLRPATDQNLLTVWGRGPSDIWTGGMDVSAHFDGTAWTAHAWTLPGNLSAIAGSATEVFAMSRETLAVWDGAAWTATGPNDLDQVLDLAVDAETGDPVVIARLADGGPRRVLRRVGNTWVDLGTPGDWPHNLSVLDGGVVSVVTDEGWYLLEDGRWRVEALPESGPGIAAAEPIVGTRGSGLFATMNTGGLYHLPLQGGSPWR